MRFSHTILLGLGMLTPALCHAQAQCPWLNEATAHGILGGDVTLSVKLNKQGAGVCKFTRHHGAANRELRISVTLLTDIPRQFPAYLTQCPPRSTPLRATGNEAVTCSKDTKEDHYAEIVVGRVRNQAFAVVVNSTVQDDPSMTQEMRRDRAKLAAEMVAGILF